MQVRLIQFVAVATAWVALSPQAQAGYGAGGVRYSSGYVEHIRGLFEEEGGLPGPGLFNCFGGGGYGVGDDHMRVGGNGTFCSGKDGTLSYGGGQVGWQGDFRLLYPSVYADLGVGFAATDLQADRTGFTPYYRALFAYAKPTASLGLPLGFAAVEAGVYAMLPLPLITWTNTEEGVGATFPHLGLQLSLLFGGFDRDGKGPDR